MILYPDIKDCCNCNGCTQICPKEAIYKKTDEDGFIYPHIDQSKCIDCGLCQKVCAYQHIEETNVPLKTYAATSTDTAQKMKSASGGIFAVLATKVIKSGGIVYGAEMVRNEDGFEIRHVGIESINDLKRLQGSKYVQSNIGECYKEIRKHLIAGREVLFSGVPCQCAGLKGFLMGKDYPNLTIVDIICHGVPSQKLFNDYIAYTFKDSDKITGYKFRDKSSGWELAACVTYKDGTRKLFPAGTDSYYSLFLDQQTYRLNCYSCKYASEHRPGDLTIGDYWGIEKQHPEFAEKADAQKGISCIIVNTPKGEEVLKDMASCLELLPSTYEQVAARNAQLTRPSNMGRYRDEVFRIYRKEGYAGVASFFKAKYKKQRIIHRILSMMPYSLKAYLRKLKNA